jgi:neutral ceramidase
MVVVLLGAFAACRNWGEKQLPVPLSPSRRAPPDGSFRAGFARVDITPPPGVGLSGNGPESKRAAGYRLRLHARALVLQDANGEKVAIVVADLGHLSANLHRLTADSIDSLTGIGADRLIISATHTHAGPSHHYAERQYNQSISQVSGYDPRMVAFLVSRFARAVLKADSGLRPACIAWSQTPVWGHTRNRSYDAYLRDKPAWPPPFAPPPGLDPVHTAVDPTWTMLRVDTVGPDHACHPAGAFSIFAFHGTGNPAANDLFDPDIQGISNRVVERHIDSLNHDRQAFGTRAVHLLANGTEGDVSPDWPKSSRCDVPTLRPSFGPGGPRTPPLAWEWREPSRAHVAVCLSAGRAYVDAVGDTLGRRAAALFDSLHPKPADSVHIAVRFRTLHLRGYDGLCDGPRIGTSTAAGAADGTTRVRGWRLFGIIPLGFEEGGSAVKKNPKGCQREKQILGGFLQPKSIDPFVGEHGLPEVAQLSVISIGDLLLGAVPAEVTTVAGFAMKQAMRDSADAHGFHARGVAVIGLANGYLQYVTTDAEYGAQAYEGGSNLYGPKSAAVLGSELGRLAGGLGGPPGESPVNTVDSIMAYPGSSSDILPDSSHEPKPGRIKRRFDMLSCQGDTLVARWWDAGPDRMIPPDTAMIEVERNTGDAWEAVVRDDDPYLEVRAIGPKKKDGFRWELRWDHHGLRSGRVRVVILARGALAGTVSEECTMR